MTSLMPQALPDRAYIVVDAQNYKRRTVICTESTQREHVLKQAPADYAFA